MNCLLFGLGEDLPPPFLPVWAAISHSTRAPANFRSILQVCNRAVAKSCCFSYHYLTALMAGRGVIVEL
ncbi:hypothetical protein HOS54_gp213 [Klebsiella phage Menlow]|uniref:Uncharacterized protein n=1 Tax=Klebsiella phage Menlow TaxID=2054273 RepID=A0A2H5BNN3_9CAUD|nr:hypothetical protein HOS54_gp213 [Klebsiella phage Menlow]AUG87736.1 hypothetical protein CPT_Menlow_035 [Klebsiella phage Menlow]